MQRQRIVIMGAAGRDFHDFNVCFRNDANYEVVAFTAAQIPNIADRLYPAVLAGHLYPAGIPIYPETELEFVLRNQRIDQVVFAYSDVSHEYVMHRASVVLAAGADFWLLGTRRTQLKSTKPVVSVCAVRTGSGNGATARRIAAILRARGFRVAPVRHPMPYGDLAQQAVQQFDRFDDLDRQQCTIEEREEYEPRLEEGYSVFAGVDYERILRLAEQNADVILWDGGNNDLAFFVPDFHVVVADPHRLGHERSFHPGEANVRAADVLVINKVDTATPEKVQALEDSLKTLNPRAVIVKAASPISVADPQAVCGKRVLVIEDGPTLTHGGMPFGAASLAARRFGAAVIVDPRPAAVGTIRETYQKYPELGPVLPAMGYGPDMIRELEQTINGIDADLVLVGTPIDLGRFLKINKLMQRVRYGLQESGKPTLEDLIQQRFLQRS